MKIVPWMFQENSIAVLDVGNEVYATTEMVAKSLGVPAKAVRNCFERNRADFEGCSTTLAALSASNQGTKEFFDGNRTLLGLSRLRSDVRLWNGDGVITFTFLLNAERARQFRKEYRALLRSQFTKGVVSIADHERLRAEFTEMCSAFADIRTELSALHDRVGSTVPSIKKAASAAGRALAAHKGIRLGDLN